MPFELGNDKFFFWNFSGHALRADAGSVTPVIAKFSFLSVSSSTGSSSLHSVSPSPVSFFDP